MMCLRLSQPMMKVPMRIRLYTVCWNEARMLPYFLRHYEQFCDSIVVYDHKSDDGSAEILDAHPLCERRSLSNAKGLDDGVLLDIKCHVWKECRDRFDWVICCDVDEFLYHPDLPGYSQDCLNRGVSIPAPTGWQMVSDDFPSSAGQLYDHVMTGFEDSFYNKRIVFNPTLVQEINYSPGCHAAHPQGVVCEDADPDLKMLHFKYLGLEYLKSRYAELAAQLSDFNRAHGFGWHYLQSHEQLESQFRERRQRTVTVPLRIGDSEVQSVTNSGDDRDK